MLTVTRLHVRRALHHPVVKYFPLTAQHPIVSYSLQGVDDHMLFSSVSCLPHKQPLVYSSLSVHIHGTAPSCHNITHGPAANTAFPLSAFVIYNLFRRKEKRLQDNDDGWSRYLPSLHSHNRLQ